MSKRFFPENHGDRKRAKLDFSVSDHNFPLSQNKDAANWGDDNDDEILLLASQACEQAYSDLSLLPDYSICMQPGSTSTQVNPMPSTSKTEFTFKRPTAHPSSVLSTQLKEKCNRISSPLPGITPKIISKTNGHAELSDDDFMFSDKILKGQDSEQTYRQLLQLQEENAKLKSENGKLLEKCVTKEGEASILRTQLKSCQVSVDNARLEKIKAQEKVQMEWTEKLTTANNQMRDLRTQLDFKNLEIISIKEKCKKLESTKVKLTQVTVANNDISMSQRRQTNHSFHNESLTQSKRVNVTTNAVQTEDKLKFMVINKSISKDKSSLSSLLPLILEPSSTNQFSLIDYNEKLSRSDTLQKCRVYKTFHRIPSTPVVMERVSAVQISSLYEDFSAIASGTANKDHYFNVFKAVKSVLAEVSSRLEMISQRMTSAFQKEMDERYIEGTSTYLEVRREDLLKGRTLFKEEQEVQARRLIAMLAYILATPPGADMFNCFELSAAQNRGQFLEGLLRICSALDDASCATLYSGLLLAICAALASLPAPSSGTTLEIIKRLVTCRPMTFVVIEVLCLVRQVSTTEGFLKAFCPGSNVGNLKTDYDQGVLLYKKDSCHMQVLVKQVESCLKCIARSSLAESAARVARQLMMLYGNVRCGAASALHDQCSCDCLLVLIQVIVYSLRICAVMLNTYKDDKNATSSLLCACRCGVQVVFACGREPERAHAAGYLRHFCDIMQGLPHEEPITNMLSELAGTLQSSPEDTTPAFHRQPWLKSFDQFSISD